MSVIRLIFGAASAALLFIYLLGEEERLVHYLGAPNFFCLNRWITPIPTACVRRAALPCIEGPASHSSL
jgi:hypothetical protein